MKFSIIIPVREINSYLEENILALKSLDYKNFEVIIITDETSDYDFEDERFQIVVSGSKSPGEKRNLGASKATGDVLAFLDDDAYPREDWLIEAAKIFREIDTYAVGGPSLTPPKVSFLEKVSGYILESPLTSAGTSIRHKIGKETEIEDWPTVNLLVVKQAFNEVGGFDSKFWPGEDTKLCLDLINKYKKPFLYAPEVVVYHHRRKLFLPFLKQISRFGKHRGHFAKIFPKTSLKISYFVPSMFLLFLIVGAVLSFTLPYIKYVYFGSLGIYLIFLLYEFSKVSVFHSLKAGFLTIIGIFSTHVVYGLNFIIGLIFKPKLKLRKIDKETGNYLGG